MFAVIFGFTAFHAAVVLSAVLLGHFGVLRPATLLPAAFVAAGALLFALRRELFPPLRGGGGRGRGHSSLPSPPLRGAGEDVAERLERASSEAPEELVSQGGKDRRGPLPALRATLPRAAQGREASALVLVIVGLFVSLAIFRSWTEPPGRYSYDDTHYHLTAVATWYQNADLRMVKFPVGDGSPAFYPIASELFSYFLLCLTAPSDILARWSELPFALLSICAAFVLARKLGISRQAALAVAVFAALTPKAFPEKMLSAGNDHATAFYLLTSLVGAFHFAEGPSRGRAVLLGLPLGLLAGTKYTGLMFVPPALAIVAFRLWETREVRTDSAPIWRLLALALVTALSVGGYTYLRNWVTAGSPLFPATIKVFGMTLFPGWRSLDRSMMEKSPEFAIAPLRFLTSRPDLWGPHFVFLLLPAVLIAPLVAILLGKGRKWSEVLVLATPVFLYIVFLRLVPDHREIRYIFAAPALGALCLAWIVDRGLSPRFRAAAPALLGLSIALLAVRFYALVKSPTEVNGKSYLAGRLAESAAAEFIEKAGVGKPLRVAILGTNQPYLFMGNQLQNRVSYVPIHDGAGAEFYSWRSPLDFPHRSLDPSRKGRGEIFWKNLLEREIQGIVIARTGTEYPAAAWVSNDPYRFKRVFAQEGHEIYVLDPTAAKTPDAHGFVTIDEGLPASVDSPTDGAVVNGDLVIRGWCVERGGGRVDPTEVRIDGERLEWTKLTRSPREDVSRALPEMGDTSQAGYEITIPAARLAPGTHKLVVAFTTPGLRVRYYPAVTIQVPERSAH